MVALFPFQVEGARALSARTLCLGDECGLGKTRTAFEAARRARVDHLFVLCPAVVRTHWKREYDAGAYPFDLYVESYQRYVVSESARRRFGFSFRQHAALVLDEFHFLKNADSQRTRYILGTKEGLVHWAPWVRVWPLSGTPMPRNPAEMFPILLALWPERLKERGVETYPKFLERFCKFRWTEYGPRIYGVQDVTALRDLLQGVMLRRLTRVVAPELPPLRWGIVSITPAESFRAPELPAGITSAILRGEFPPVNENLARYRHAIGDAKAPVAAELIASELDADDDAKRVVFAYHKSVLDYLEYALARYNVVRIDGDVPQSARPGLVQSFARGTARVFLGQLQACATGLDGLQYGSHDAILVEPDWATDVNIQAGKRVSRIGSTLPGLARMLSLSGTLDDAIVRNHYREVQMVQEVLQEEGV